MHPIASILTWRTTVFDFRAPTTGTTKTARHGSTTETGGTAPAIRPAERVGRFEVRRCIGMGGMGQVYAAYDPQLDRTVALKVLHGDRNRRHDPRLVREALALARVSHPNVVAVHDAGVHQGRLFLAMELVEGVTLRDWLQQRPVGAPGRLAAVLDALIQAGRGLAAAHRAGLVHRDFKPGNVLVGHDGRVRVVDFGLVRVAEAGVEGPAERGRVERGLGGDEVDEGDPWGLLLDDRPLTRPGALVGTPAYMAPEQLMGTTADAATDQFGFCVTAWEAIFGTRAFPGKTLLEVIERTRRGRPVRPREVECPRAVELALRRGLAFAPGRRHVSMEALLGVLEAARARLGQGEGAERPRVRLPWPTTLALAGVAVSWVLAAGPVGRAPCAGAEERLVGIWDDTTKRELQRAFLRTGDPAAGERWERLEEGLDAYAQGWQAGYREACEATQVRHEQSAELMHLRMACLDTRRQALGRLVEAYGRADAAMVEEAMAVVRELEPVSGCADQAYVRRRVVEPQREGLEESRSPARGGAPAEGLGEASLVGR